MIIPKARLVLIPTRLLVEHGTAFCIIANENDVVLLIFFVCACDYYGHVAAAAAAVRAVRAYRIGNRWHGRWYGRWS